MKRRSAIVTIATTLGLLVAGKRNGWSEDQLLVLEALRRSSTDLNDARVSDLASYLSGLSPEQMRGTLSNVKGIFHELLVARAENADGDGLTAGLFTATNHPGADLEFWMDGDVVREVQLKAVQSPTAIMEHLERYPDTDVLATSEVATILEGIYGDRVADSGFTNEAITAETRQTLEALAGQDIGDFIDGDHVTSALITGAIIARSALSGQRPEMTDIRSMLELAGVGVGTAFVVDTLLELV